MAGKRSVQRTWTVLLGILMVIMLTASTALAATSPQGVVTDEAGLFSSSQLKRLEDQLLSKHYNYRVIILDRAFTTTPANEELEFERLAERFLEERRIPKDAVMILIGWHERLVQFHVWADGSVNAHYLQQTRQEFGRHSDYFLSSFRAGFEAGLDQAILRAVDAIETVSPATAPPVTSPPVGSPSPVTNTPTPAPQSAPQPTNWSFLWWLAAIVGLVPLIIWFQNYRTYKRKYKEADEVRNSFLGDLLKMKQRELPLARNYQGEETRSVTEAAVAAGDLALRAQQEGEQARQEAEQLAKKLRFGRAVQVLNKALTAYREGAEAFARLQKAWEPIAQALRSWDPVTGSASEHRSSITTTMETERTRNGWPLTHMAKRLEQGNTILQEAKAARDSDPVKAIRLAQAAEEALRHLQTDAAALPQVAAQLAEQQAQREQAQGQIDEARRSLGFRFVELSPDAALQRALERETEARERLLPEGNVEGARQALSAGAAAVTDALGILTRYREAYESYPGKMTQLSVELAGLATDEDAARAVLPTLSKQYSQDDWADVKDLPEALASLQSRIRSGLDQVSALTTPAEQRYLQATSLLDGWIAEREQLRHAFSELKGRPEKLAAMARQAQADLQTAKQSLNAAHQTITSNNLKLSPALQSQLDQLQYDLRNAESIGQGLPLKANRFARSASDLTAAAGRVRQSTDELARQATSARSSLQQAHAAAMRAAAYERYGNASMMRAALAAADSAMAAGQYQTALSESQKAMQGARALEAAYQEHMRRQRMEAERRRAAAMAAAAAMSRRGGGGGGRGGGGGFGGRGSGGGGGFGGRGSGGGGRF